ncbi:MAG: NusG domain II-containing protein [Clostridia bacterium]|nr:NusG domain II-containing protein [Clostridia bacterium]
MKIRDIIIIAALLVCAGALYLVSQVSLGGVQASTIVVTQDGEEVLRRPLALENTYEIAQEDGSLNVIAVKDGAVFMQEANCRDGLCIRQGKMKNAAKTIVCLPHKIVVQLTGDAPVSDDSDLDIIIQ